MRMHRTVVLSLSLAVTCLAAGPALAQAKSPSEAYLAYVAAANKAKSLEELFPHLSKEWVVNLKAQPKEKWAVWLERYRTKRTAHKIVKETITGDTCKLEVTAREADGTPLSGNAGMVREDGVWKLDGDGYVPAGR